VCLRDWFGPSLGRWVKRTLAIQGFSLFGLKGAFGEALSSKSYARVRAVREDN
jgi:hypothetical protein